MSGPTAPPGPGPVWEIVNGFGAYWALHAAVELGVFDTLADGARTSGELAAATGIGDEGDLLLLAQVLASHGLLDTDGSRWQLTPVARRFLLTSAPTSMVELVGCSPGPHAAWPKLPGTLRAGRPDPTTGAALEQLYPALVRATAGTQAAVAAGVATELRRRGTWDGPEPVIVDLGCGSGVWLDALLAEAGPGARGVALDRGPVLSVAAPRLARHRVDLVEGDYLETELPVERADVVVLAHVLRAEPDDRAQELVERALDLLHGRGVLVVADYFRPADAQPTQSYLDARHDLALSLTMRASTAGRGLTEAQLTGWCGASTASIDVLEPLPRQRVHLIAPRPLGGSR